MNNQVGYFDIKNLNSIAVEVRGKCIGKMIVSTTPDFSNIVCEILVCLNGSRVKRFESKCKVSEGKQEIYFKFSGKGILDFYFFELMI